MSWVLSPIAGCILAFVVFKIIVKLIFAEDNPVEAAKLVGPGVTGITAFLIVSSPSIKTNLSNMMGVADISEILLISGGAGVTFVIVSVFLLRKIKAQSFQDYTTVERIFKRYYR